MSFFRSRNGFSPIKPGFSPVKSWRSSFTNSANTSPPSSSPRMCRFGSTCVKFGCTFKHPPSRPQDCPEGANCLEVKCPLHHPKSRPIKQYEHPKSRQSHPCTLSFSGLPRSANPAPRHPRLSQGRASCTPGTSRYSNRMIVRSPMVVPTPNNRPRTGYLAATSKPCIHGAACVKYGCTYKHPASRATNCALGMDCKDSDCTHLHPLDVHGTGVIDAGFAVGQQVQAKFLPTSKKWSDATIHCIRGSALTLQFHGFSDAFEVPLRRVRHPSDDNEQPPTLVWSRCPTTPPNTPPPSTPPPPQSSSSLSDPQQLERLKQAAVAREDFVVAEQIKQRIATVTKITDLQQQKQQAVREENFILAMNLKHEIAALLEEDINISASK